MPREGFQSIEPICNDCKACDRTNTITNFPASLTSVSDELYDSVHEPITMNFQWSTHSIPQSFRDNTGIIREGNYAGSGTSNTTTLQYNNIRYTLHYVQITNATHTSWILPTPAADTNKEDIIITFYTTNSTAAHTYITLVIPIIRIGIGNTDPNYLQGLGNSNIQGTFSLSQCLPDSKSQFALYATCIDGYTAHKDPQNIYVCVSVEGIKVSSTLMNTLSSSNTRFKEASLPYMLTPSTMVTRISTTDFTRYIQSTRHLLDYNNIKNLYKKLGIDTRIDSTSSYQCVPLDPDNDVIDGKLQVDLTNGTLLTEVLAERDATRAVAGRTDITKEQKAAIEKRIGIIIGIIFAGLLIIIVTYSFLSYFGILNRVTAVSATTPATVPLPAVFNTQYVVLVVAAIGAGIGGYFIGLTNRQ
jgi:hypothetical protein